MSKVVERWADGRPKTIKSDPTNTIYSDYGKGSLTRKMSPEDKAKFDAEMKRLFPKKVNKAVAAEDDPIRKELEDLRRQFGN